MPKYDLLTEADGLEEQIAKKYQVPTYNGYSKDLDMNLSEFQELAFTLVYFMHCFNEKPRTITINRQKAIKLLRELGEIPKEIEGVPISFSETEIFEVTSYG